jgi:predicted flap endonuclease-1-like 5' DNA nuclease
MAALRTLEGDAFAGKLRAAGVRSTDALLQMGSTTTRRKTLAAKSGTSPAEILRAVNEADLFRIRGVGHEFAELLEAAGVESVPQLAKRNAAHLTTQLAEVCRQRRIECGVPSQKMVAGLIAQAKALPRVVMH